MIERTFSYEVKGTTAEGVAWQTAGTVVCELPEVWVAVINHTFLDLTRGKAVFGRPGLGCKGPYEVHEVTVKRIDGHAR